MKRWWSDKAKPWLKRNWKWIILPVGILMAIVSMPRRRKLQASSELLGAAKVEREAEAVADAAVEKAKAEKEVALQAIEEDHAKVIEELTDEQRGQVEELREDPEKLNSFLMGVGKDIRGK